ncbi:hypothetical protein CCO03_17290 [Comamonas serinivorans]|uniref:EF-hand domain-containing protein n=1 Tax=Comamonas serinivorans TaxID=1082851 RepID=A0A1Y0ERA3_9BURK|nr:EF-hand domain-containing protein [Comamonas serinivorans]ARU06194.1 hypothetical protein CCO03_17290 [Comamonas serinivorans]
MHVIRFPALAARAACLSALLILPLGAQAQSTASAPASAASQPSKGERQAEIWFKMLDTNRDGYLSWDEVKHIPPLAKDFKAADTDGNGLVSRAEIRALSKKRLAERRAREAQEARDAQAPASAPTQTDAP